MPLFELQPSYEGRIRVFVRAQLPFVVMSALIVIGVAIALPTALVIPAFLIGAAVVAITAAAALWIPWERFNRHWLITIAVADFAAIACLRYATHPEFTAVGILIIFPALWLAYGFAPPVAGLAVVGAVFVTSLPFLLTGTAPGTPLEWVNVLTLPTATLLVAFGVQTAATQLRRSRRRSEMNAEALSEALRESRDNESIARSVFETVESAMAFYSADNQPVFANRAAHAVLATLGLTLDSPPLAGGEVYASDRTTRIPPEEQIIPRALRGEEISRQLEWIGPPGRQTAILASARRARRETGEVLGTVIVAYDITELVEAVAVREQFLMTVSHELRTPLTSIIGYLEILEDSVDADVLGISDYLDVVKRNSTELLARVGQLLTFTDRATPTAKRNSDISAIVGTVIERSLPSVQSAGLSLSARLHEALHAVVDPRAIEQVVENLLSNAIKYSPGGQTIDVALDGSDHYFTVTVSDTGRGMTPDEQRQVFDRFYRAPSARSDAVQGFGVGLAIVKDIVEEHHGSITVESASGSGTTMTVRIPVAFDPWTVEEA